MKIIKKVKIIMKRKTNKIVFWKPVKRKPIKYKPVYFKLKQVSNTFALKPMKIKPNYKRTIAERKLIRTNPWGDKDGDAVPNWIDCKPFDRKRQGRLGDELNRRLKKVEEDDKKLRLNDFKSDDDDEYAVDAEMKKKYINNEDMKEQLRERIKESGGKYGSLSRLAAQDPPIKHKIAYESDDDEYEEEAEGSKKSKGGQDK
jgi:hypothetical protein